MKRKYAKPVLLTIMTIQGLRCHEGDGETRGRCYNGVYEG